MMKISAVTAALLLLFLTGACSREPSGQTETGSRVGQEAGSEAIQETGSEAGLTAGPEAVEETIPEAGQETGSEVGQETFSETGQATASGTGQEPASPAAMPSDAPHADILLTAPPEISLTDSLSSLYEPFSLGFGVGEWCWLENGQTVASISCGASPLDMDPEKAEKLKVPDYNGMDSVPYLLSCQVLPDSVLLREWDIQSLGDMEAKPLSETEYSEILPIGLKKDRVYELVATWDEEKLEERFFSGVVSYHFLTE